jgi:acetyl/propionyl-CoA carboxylase alpha subunit
LLSVKKSALSILLENKIYDFVIKDLTPTYTDLILSGKNRRLLYSWDPEKLLLFMSFGARNFSFQRNDFLSKEDLSKRVKKQDSEGSDNIHAPLNGKILRVNINNNQMVMQGETILVIESMKMENEIRLPSAALIKRVFVKPGQWVSEGEILAHVQAETL